MELKGFKGRSVLSALDFDREDYELLFKTAEKMEPVVRERRTLDILKDKVMGVCFFQPSTRTRVSFESAMARLGGKIVGFADPSVTRAGKDAFYQETVYDVVKMMESYADVLVIRHYTSFVPRDAAAVVSVPVISGGDGTNEHPTQAMLDLYTILKGQGRLDDLSVAVVGDLTTRPLHSFAYAMSYFHPKRFYAISPAEQAYPPEVLEKIRALGLPYEEVDAVEKVIPEVDVIYMIGTKHAPNMTLKQRERNEEVTAGCRVTPEKLRRAKANLMVMHPLPRTEELPPEVDKLPQAWYFKEAWYGVPVRMALLTLVLKGGIE